MKKSLLLGITMLFILALFINTPPGSAIELTGTPTPEASRPVVVHIPFTSQAELDLLADQYDVWEVRKDEGYVVAYVSASEFAQLASNGYDLFIDEALSDHPDTIPGFPCYRTIVEYDAAINSVAASYPELARLQTIGTSYEARPLRVLILTNQNITGPKPVFFLMANIHGREVLTPEAAMVYIERLTNGYGTDPDMTYLLDYHEIHVLVSANPDGHVKNEPGQPWAYWRKNVQPYGSCAATELGVDLNRNATFKWGCCGGSSSNPCNDTYRGPSAGSEIETSAVENYMLSIFPDQRGPGDTDPAPDTTTGVMITLHQYSNLVLWPWGWTYSTAPNVTGLQALGTKLATYNGYTPQQSTQLYITDGTTDDWAYGVLGIAAYTFEMGSSSDGFYPACSRYDAIIQPNIPALLYAAKVSGTPYLTSRGPDALNLSVTTTNLEYRLEATINDINNGGNSITQAQFTIDEPYWRGATTYAMQPKDGVFNSPNEAVTALVSTQGLSLGRHTLFVRGRDSAGFWGPLTAVFFDVLTDSTIEGQVVDSTSATPLAGATLAFASPDLNGQVTSGSDGTYSFDAIVGTYTATVSLYGYHPLTLGGIEVVSGETTTQDFALDPVTSNTVVGTVREIGSNLPLEAEIVAEGTPRSTTSSSETGEFSLELPLGVFTLTVSAPGYQTQMIAGFEVLPENMPALNVYLIPTPCVLVVDDDYYSSSQPHAYETYYTQALDDLGVLYDLWDARTQPSLGNADMSAYPVVLWLTGDAVYNTLTGTNQQELISYMNAGGNLFLTGQNIAQDIYGDPGLFFTHYLKAGYAAGSTDQTSLVGAGLFAGQALEISGGTGAGNQTNPDVITAGAGAAQAFTYAGGEVAGVSAETSNFRSIFMAYGVEGIAAVEDRRAVLATGLSWLGCSPAGVELLMDLQGPTEPVKEGDLVTYTLSLENFSAVHLTELVITDTLPAELEFVSASIPASVTGNQLVWSGYDLASLETLTLTIVGQVRTGLAPEVTAIVHDDYEARALQMPAPVAGTAFVITPMEHGEEPPPPPAPKFTLYLPLISH